MIPSVQFYWDQFIRGRKATPETQGYRRLEWSTLHKFSTVLDKNAKKTLDVDGDHLTIFRVTGPSPVLVRLGGDENPFIPIYSRMVLKRPFRRITFVDGGLPDVGGATISNRDIETRVLAFASHGPLVERFPERTYGLKRNPPMFYGIPVTTTPTDLMELIWATGVVPAPTLYPTVGLDGGTLLLKNTGGIDLYLDSFMASGARAGGSAGFGPIEPGQSIELRLDDWLFKYPNSLDGGGFGVKTIAGSTTISVMLTTGEVNGSEAFQSLGSVEVR